MPAQKPTLRTGKNLVLFLVLFFFIDNFGLLETLNPSLFNSTQSASSLLTSGELFGTCAPIEELRELNKHIYPILMDLKATPFFRTYMINLERECPFWAMERLCNNEHCSVSECDKKDVPNFWNEREYAVQPSGQKHDIVKSSDHFSSVFIS